MSSPASASSAPPLLCVDLDGTLCRSDTPMESFCLLLRNQPWVALRAPLWLLSGRSRFVREVSGRAVPRPELLPYDEEVLAYLRDARAHGQRLYLVTASDERIAQGVADHLGLFEGVLAGVGDATSNGATKLAGIRARVGQGRLAYVGSSRADLEVWAGADETVVVGASRSLRAEVERLGRPSTVIGRRPAAAAETLRAMRPYQWTKNVLLLAPLVLAHALGDTGRLWATAAAVVAFCAVASFGYVFNDLLDIEADRAHPTKRRRPFAAGTLSITTGLTACVGLLVVGFTIASSLVSLAFTGMLAIYLVSTLAYSLYLKEKLFLDVLVLAGLYTHRVLSGGVAADVPISTWLLAFSVFFFLSLALVKRYVELRDAIASQPEGASDDGLAGRAYRAGDTSLVGTMGVASGYVSILVIGLYVSGDDVTQRYSSPQLLWIITPLMLYWISRIWLLAQRGEVDGDPVLFAAKDRLSYVVVGSVVLVGAAAAWVGR